MGFEPPALDRESAPPPHGAARDYIRSDEERAWMQSALALIPAVCGGFAAIFLFFALMGAIDPSDAVAATAVAVLFALVWAAAFYHRMRTNAGRVQWRDRERRGF